MSQFEYTLEILSGAPRTKQKIVLPCILGRGPDANFKLEDTSVSKHHARLSQQGDEIIVLDLKSANGTYVNGKRIEARVLKSGDIISCASVQIRFLATPVTERDVGALAGDVASQDSSTPGSDAGYEAAQQATEANAEAGPKLSFAEKLLVSFDKIFLPFYRKTFAAIAFPKILIPVVVGVFIVLVVLTLTPQIEQTQQIIRIEAQKRAMLMAKRLLDINKIYLDQDKDHLLTVAPVLDEPEVVDAYIATPDGKIMAPERRYGQFVTHPEALRAVKSNSSYVEEMGAFGIIASQPVYRYSQAKGANEVYAVAVVMTSTRGVQLESSSMIVLWLQVILFIVASGVLVSFLFIRIFTQPWKDVEAQIEKALQTEAAEIPLVMNFSPVKHATRAINSALFKAKEGSSAGIAAPPPPEPEITVLEVSELGEVLTRTLHKKDAGWVKERVEKFETGATLSEIDPQLGEWFLAQKGHWDRHTSVSKIFSAWEVVVTCYRKETLYCLVFSRSSES